MKLTGKAAKYYTLLCSEKFQELNEKYRLASAIALANHKINKDNGEGFVHLHLQRWKDIVEIQKLAFTKAYDTYEVELNEGDVQDFFISLEQQSKDILDDECERNSALIIHHKRILDGFYKINISTRNQLQLYCLELERLAEGTDMNKIRKRNSFESLLRRRGQTVLIRPNNSSGAYQITAIKESKNEQPMFLVKWDNNLHRGDELQIVGASDWWRVADKEDITHYNEVVFTKIRVTRIDSQANNAPISAAQITTNFYAPFTGAFQVAGSKNTQTVSINITNKFDEAISELLTIVKTSSLDELDKEEAIEAIEWLPKLAQKEKTPGLLERAEKRINSLETIFTKGGTILAMGLPHLQYLYSWFQSK